RGATAAVSGATSRWSAAPSAAPGTAGRTPPTASTASTAAWPRPPAGPPTSTGACPRPGRERWWSRRRARSGGLREPAEPAKGHGGPGDQEQQGGGREQHRDLLLLLDEADLGAELAVDVLELAGGRGGVEPGPGGAADPLEGQLVGRDRDPAHGAGLVGHVDHAL